MPPSLSILTTSHSVTMSKFPLGASWSLPTLELFLSMDTKRLVWKVFDGAGNTCGMLEAFISCNVFRVYTGKGYDLLQVNPILQCILPYKPSF